MNIYILTISENGRHRRVVHIARSLSVAFSEAIEFYGRACVSCIKPWRAAK